MRPAWWAYVLMGVLTCSVTYPFLYQPSLPSPPLGVSDEFERRPVDHNSDRPLIHKETARLQDVDPAPDDLKPDQLPIAKDQERLKADQLPIAQHQARLQVAVVTDTIELSAPNDTQQDLSYLA